MQTLFHIDKDKNVILALAIVQSAKNTFPLLEVFVNCRLAELSSMICTVLTVKKETKQKGKRE